MIVPNIRIAGLLELTDTIYILLILISQGFKMICKLAKICQPKFEKYLFQNSTFGLVHTKLLWHIANYLAFLFFLKVISIQQRVEFFKI